MRDEGGRGSSRGSALSRLVAGVSSRAIEYGFSKLELWYFLGSKVASSSSGGRKHRVASTA